MLVTSLFLFGLQLVATESNPPRNSSESVTTWFRPNGKSACPPLKADNISAIALSSVPFANGTACHALIKIESPKGVVAYGRVTDLCPKPYCKSEGLNLSPELFSRFAPLSDGVVTGLRWSFVSSSTSQPTYSLHSDFVEDESHLPTAPSEDTKDSSQDKAPAPAPPSEETKDPSTSSYVKDPSSPPAPVPEDKPVKDTPTSSSAAQQATPVPKPQPENPKPATMTTSYKPATSSIAPTTTTYEPKSTPVSNPHTFSGRITWYNPSVGIGACGTANSDEDHVLALNSAQYPGQCGKKITIKGNGKEVSATVMDECPTCGHGDIDLSPAVFKRIAGLNVGTLPVTWNFV